MNEPENGEAQVITYKGTNIVDLPQVDLVEALREGFAELTVLRARLSDEGRMEAAREEDFKREIEARRDFFGVAAEYQSRMFDAATAYNQLIVIGGYAAFFSVWGAFANDLDKVLLVSSGVLIVISIMIYLAWTVVGMFQLGRRNIEGVASFGAGVEGFMERLQAVEVASQERSQKLLKWWKPVTFGAGGTALVAALLLGGGALWSLMPKPQRPHADPLAATLRQAKAAAQNAECNANIAKLYAQERPGVKATATNPSTGQNAVLIDNKWVIIPKC
jgi:hypothetical protein